MRSPAHLVIAISRQFGAGGSVLGRRVADRLGIRYLDRAILQEAAARLNEAEEELAPFEERTPGFGERFLNAFAAGALEAGLLSVPPRYDRDVFSIESQIIGRVADEFDCVIVGRGSFFLLRDHPGALRVFLHAPIEFRIAQIRARRPDLDPGRVPSLVRRSDAERTRFIRSLTEIEWTDSRHYDLSIDTERVGFDAAEEMILLGARMVRARLGGQG